MLLVYLLLTSCYRYVPKLLQSIKFRHSNSRGTPPTIQVRRRRARRSNVLLLGSSNLVKRRDCPRRRINRKRHPRLTMIRLGTVKPQRRSGANFKRRGRKGGSRRHTGIHYSGDRSLPHGKIFNFPMSHDCATPRSADP
jgi:hypothetical protein